METELVPPAITYGTLQVSVIVYNLTNKMLDSLYYQNLSLFIC